MVSKTKTAEEETKNNKRKKASTGAWWKSTETETQEEKKTVQSDSPEKEGSPSDKKNVPAKKTSSAKAPAKRGRPRKKIEVPQPQESGAEVKDSSKPEKEEEKKQEAKPKRAPRARKSQNKENETGKEQVKAAIDDKNQTDEKSVTAKEEKKDPPKRRGRPRKKPETEKTSSASGEEGVAEKVHAPKKRGRPKKKANEKVEEKKEVSSEIIEETKGEKQVEEKPKSPRKRSPRKKSPSAQKTPVAGELSTESAESTEDLKTAVTPSESTETVESKPKRRGRPRKKPQADKTVSEEPQQSQEEPPKKRPGRKKKKPQPQSEKVPQTDTKIMAGNQEPPAADKEESSELDVEKAEIKVKQQDAVKAEQIAEDQEQTEPAEIPETEEKAEADTDPEGDAQVDQSKAQEQKAEAKEPEHKPVIKLLINAEEPEECRLALLEDGRLESIHVATVTRTQTKNNIYKAKVVAIEPNLQAAFVEYGSEKNGFLPFSEIHPEYYKEDVTEKVQKLIDNHQWKKLSISDVIEKGRELLVQVVKEEVGKKGANMTTYLSLPGRCVVLMPGSDSTGISRKISGEERRSQLREAILSMDIPEGIGWIVRTASIDITKAALKRDVSYLIKLWDDIKTKGQELEGVGLIYQDHNHVLRFLREHFDPDIQEIQVDDKEALEQVKSFVELLPSKQRNVKCKLHRGSRPIFNQYSIEDQIESIYQPKVNLPSGGSIVIDPTEALVAIDVNSGSTARGQNFEETIFQANMEAAKELARQLRLRDLGGLIVVDFIDMRSKKHIREVERKVKNAMKRDKAKVDFSRISKFGLMQISRQKLGAPIEAGNYRVCNHCKGRGMVRSVETLALYYLRRIHTGATRKPVYQVECRFPLDVAQYLLNNKRQELRDLENKYNSEVIIIADPALRPADNEIIFHKAEKEDSAKKRA